ncbi:MAG: hypothetical protein A2268_07795 [Candidatus Raymondbacteria bacterium RifOxyA12_full_50_37]|uniref:LTD domain-containing protein n=1 Tax=Candidatus Raymondbacteria bacterium RIFOXYD12_FULL_49_13 TaxID=1817890 RepID=A0A1F7F7Y6_UNCRA|nr:MAG: hypothetical protein A2268_07795 [Candidatus Raymondbacteria bacterium RifOxyA12_full_50_37]OGJ88955.1 MAG: hypothetical protein A2350_12445 [Candidatus Raymondbacteria bacterium RifOxyB12_full_50_8]OGJ89608.1 MAG: hypothetical protein A2248_09515 [Candidatus Raymondbacteria bacterium RIFOXYA2_FULL_49_16]OGJ95512.1 MAG: hypothetical protein A2487_16990 [Candidatus Raymondbacteria bacterium RifOxyC12_full_50_8]OGK02627.1 MAG: hypothetical protein A2519_11230 [Candidatus Raymondbacteria b
MRTLLTLLLATMACLCLLHCGGKDAIPVTPDDTEGKAGKIVINEFMTSNRQLGADTIILDDQSDAADWIEFYNAGDSAMSLVGLWVTDDTLDPLQYALDDTVLQPGGFYILWCDHDSLNEFPNHAPFRLSAGLGEVIGLYRTADTSIADLIDFSAIPEARVTNKSYGRVQDGAPTWCQQSFPTPCLPNRG